MEAYKEKLFALCDTIDEKLENIEVCQKIKEKVNVRLSYIILGLVALLCLSSIISLGAGLFVNIIAIAYPSYMSIKALESDSKADDAKWLTYWVIFSIFTIVDSFTAFILKYASFYYPFKCAFLYACYSDQFNLAAIIYEKLVKVYIIPLIEKYEKRD